MSRFEAAVIFLFLLLLPFLALATNPLDVVINEIAWMGTEEGWYYEWIELYNNTAQEITVSGWKIDNGGKKNESLEISEGKISPKGYFLICKKEIENCGFKTWGLSLHNDYSQNGKLILKNETGILMDETPEPTDSKWPSGDKETNKTMERKNPLLSGNDPENWQTSQEPGGTSRAENSVIGIEPPAQSPKDIEAGPPACETCGGEPIVYPSNIFINEILASAEGVDIENEWIELSNENNFEIDLSGWQIRDKVGATKTYPIPEGTKIIPTGFLVLSRPETKITLQNSGDSLELLNPDGEIVDELNYGKSPIGQSFNRTSVGWSWSTTLTPGKENIITQPEIPKEEKTKIPQPSGVSEGEEVKKTLAQISEELPKSPNPFVVFLIGLAIAVSSAIIVLFLRKRIKSEEK